MDKVFYRHGHGLVHHLKARWNDAGCNDFGHGVACFANVVKTGHDAARQLRFGDEFDGDFGGHRQHALAAHDQGQQIQTRCVQRGAAKGDGIAFDGEAFDLQHVVNRQAIFEAMHSA